jgi:hypothetical protein
MNSRARTRATRATLVLVVGAVSLAFTVTMRAQVQTETKTSGHQATVQTTVERAKVIMLWDNNMIVEMEDGSIRHIANVPDSARATVDGKEIGIHDVKAGMTLQRTVTTISREKTITTVQSVTGTVWRVMPPTSVMRSHSLKLHRIGPLPARCRLHRLRRHLMYRFLSLRKLLLLP